ncbi:transcription initiation factor TFIID subunit 7 [Onthophagus taurus]|uniref:transcription initiation factor TFIID subunit 7 n=1 Tax=Onthophagus taurus TaxID=166361 RepID=UPI000C202089|nr:transcription initiation factor TFIID subunit 7 [Onthophagus taurus]
MSHKQKEIHRSHDNEGTTELESQFILRLPPEPAKILRDAIHNNSTLKDRISIKIENDLRQGEVRVDHWYMHAKVVDLPTIVESLKTIDSKGFYKTADICQMLLCREEDDIQPDEDTPQKKKKDPNKVEKKYLWPHGITPPAKNVRRRRFRKTLKKKYVEAPEIEKEVKRLLRSDNEAYGVKWEVINEDDDKINKGTVIKKEPLEPNQNIAEHEIFGSAVSDSEEEDATVNVIDELDDNSQISADDSHLTDSNSVMNTCVDTKTLTEFSSDMFRAINNSPSIMQEMDYYQQTPSIINYTTQNLSKVGIEQRLEELEIELNDIKERQQQEEYKIENIENFALRQRFQDNVNRLLQDQMEKEQEQYELQELLKQAS